MHHGCRLQLVAPVVPYTCYSYQDTNNNTVGGCCMYLSTATQTTLFCQQQHKQHCWGLLHVLSQQVYSYNTDKLVERAVHYGRGTGGAWLMLHMTLSPLLVDLIQETYFYLGWRHEQEITARMLEQAGLLPGREDKDEVIGFGVAVCCFMKLWTPEWDCVCEESQWLVAHAVHELEPSLVVFTWETWS